MAVGARPRPVSWGPRQRAVVSRLRAPWVSGHTTRAARAVSPGLQDSAPVAANMTPSPSSATPPVPSMETVDRCPLCGSRDRRPWRGPARDRLHGIVAVALPYARCRRCGLVYLARRVVERGARMLYDGTYAP